jgi:hypothetical protein
MLTPAACSPWPRRRRPSRSHCARVLGFRPQSPSLRPPAAQDHAARRSLAPYVSEHALDETARAMMRHSVATSSPSRIVRRSSSALRSRCPRRYIAARRWVAWCDHVTPRPPRRVRDVKDSMARVERRPASTRARAEVLADPRAAEYSRLHPPEIAPPGWGRGAGVGRSRRSASGIRMVPHA